MVELFDFSPSPEAPMTIDLRKLRTAAASVAVGLCAAVWTYPVGMALSQHAPAGHAPAAGDGAAQNDGRQLVRLPAPMQEHMLANMRDHLVTLDGIFASVAEGRFDEAARLAEERMGMSSLGLHGASHMAPFMPPPMQDLGTGMHRAASRLALVLQDASVTQSFEAMRDVSRALHEVTAACTGCHAGYRIR